MCNDSNIVVKECVVPQRISITQELTSFQLRTLTSTIMTRLTNHETVQASVDSGYGLVFRMNRLWEQVDSSFISGNLEKANFVLDRIYCNLLYREDYKYDFDGKVVKFAVTDKEKNVKKMFDARMKKLKNKSLNAMRLGNKMEAKRARAQLYHILTLKDIWLRKFHYNLGLYLKESKRSPGSAIMGGQ